MLKIIENILVTNSSSKSIVFRIIILGGSAAQGFGTAVHKSWGHLLGERLQESLGETVKKVEVINMAAGAYTSIDDYINFMLTGVHLTPDLVIIYNGWNDIAAFCGNPGWMVKNTESRLSQIQVGMESYDWNVKLKNQFFVMRKFFQLKRRMEESISVLYARRGAQRNTSKSFIKNQTKLPNGVWDAISEFGQPDPGALSFEDLLAETKIEADYIPTFPKFLKDIKKLFVTYYRTNTSSLMHVLGERRIPALFVFQPDLMFLGTERELSSRENEIGRRLLGGRTDKWKEIVKEFYPLGIEVLRTTAAEHHMPFVDMTHAIKDYRAETLFADTVHYTEEGNRTIATILYDVIVRQGLFR